MATWIVHLRLAKNLLDQIEGLDAEYFSIGSVAPDSGIPDENWEKFDPPPEILHFDAPDGEFWQSADLEFYRQHMPLERQGRIDAKRFSFLLGYFFHLVTDNLWREQIGKPTHEKFEQDFEADPKFIWQVKRDWYGLDFDHIRSHPESLFWRVFLHSEYSQDYLDFLPRNAVEQRMDYIKELYQRTDEKVEEWYGDRPDKYLHKSEMDLFIEGATGKLYRIYTYLWGSNKEVAQISSSLDLINA